MEKKNETFAAIFFGGLSLICALVFMCQLGPSVVEASHRGVSNQEMVWFVVLVLMVCPSVVGGSLLVYAFKNIEKYG